IYNTVMLALFHDRYLVDDDFFLHLLGDDHLFDGHLPSVPRVRRFEYRPGRPIITRLVFASEIGLRYPCPIISKLVKIERGSPFDTRLLSWLSESPPVGMTIGAGLAGPVGRPLDGLLGGAGRVVG